MNWDKLLEAVANIFVGGLCILCVYGLVWSLKLVITG